MGPNTPLVNENLVKKWMNKKTAKFTLLLFKGGYNWLLYLLLFFLVVVVRS